MTDLSSNGVTVPRSLIERAIGRIEWLRDNTTAPSARGRGEARRDHENAIDEQYAMLHDELKALREALKEPPADPNPLPHLDTCGLKYGQANCTCGAVETPGDAEDAARWRFAKSVMNYSFDGEHRTHYRKAVGRESFEETIDRLRAEKTK